MPERSHRCRGGKRVSSSQHPTATTLQQQQQEQGSVSTTDGRLQGLIDTPKPFFSSSAPVASALGAASNS